MESSDHRRKICSKLLHIAARQRLTILNLSLNSQIQSYKKDYIASAQEFVDEFTSIKLLCDEIIMQKDLECYIKTLQDKIALMKSANISSRIEENKFKLKSVNIIPSNINLNSQNLDNLLEDVYSAIKNIMDFSQVTKVNEHSKCMTDVNEKRSNLILKMQQLKNSINLLSNNLLELVSKSMMDNVTEKSIDNEESTSDDNSFDNTVYYA